MGRMIQRDRIYSLKIGTDEDAIEVDQLNIRFEVLKTSDNERRKNSAWVEIFNLSDSRRKKLQHAHIGISLDVGYVDTGLKSLFTGQAFSVDNKELRGFRDKKQDVDIITRVDVDELFEELNTKNMSSFSPAGSKLRDVISTIAKSIEGITKEDLSGSTIDKVLIDGYQMVGSPRSNLDRLSKTYNLQWQIDMGTLYVMDAGTSFTASNEEAYIIAQDTGLIGSPEYINESAKRNQRVVENKTKNEIKEKPNGIEIKCLLNPSIVAGSTIKLEFEELTGFYIVDEVRHAGEFRGQDWYTVIRATEKIG